MNEPGRDLSISKKNGSKITDKYIRTFAQRNGLSKYVSHNAQYAHKKTVECDICCKKFTTEKNMLSHRKVIHFGFLTWLWFQNSMEWNLLNESSSMTNVTIICSDGIIHTHKIVVASASDFIKTLLSDIPVGDEITLYLPDHDKPSIVQLLDDKFLPTLQNSPASANDVFGCQLLEAKVFW